MKVYHPEIEAASKQLTALCDPITHSGWRLSQWLWSMARTEKLGSVQFKMLADLANKFEQDRAAGS